MEQNLPKPLSTKHIGEATTEILNYMEDRRKGFKYSLRTRWKKFNYTCMGGIEPNTIMSIGGISGSGKSSFVNTLETDLIDLNPSQEIIVLSFNWEMLASRQVGRKLSYKLKKTTTQLYSAIDEEAVGDDDMNIVRRTAVELAKYPIYYCETPGSVEDVYNTISYFQQTIAQNKWLVVILDHTLLTKSRGGESERETLSSLQKVFMTLKKIGRTSIIQLTQMNRNIESAERHNNPTMHFPQRQDIFGSDSIYHASDYVIVIHRPELLNIEHYGPNKWPVENMIYLHVLKNREGELRVLQFINNLKYNSIEEPDAVTKD